MQCDTNTVYTASIEYITWQITSLVVDTNHIGNKLLSMRAMARAVSEAVSAVRVLAVLGLWQHAGHTVQRSDVVAGCTVG